MLQENRSFDSYFGMLNPYRKAKNWTVGDDGKTYTVDGIDDKLSQISNLNDEGQPIGLFKLATTCVDDMTSAWLEAYGDVNRYNFRSGRPMLMDGFVHTAEGFAKGGFGDGTFTDFAGMRSMGYYDQDTLNYYYYMASQFAISDRWFSPVASKTTPNRIATITGGTTQGLVRDPFKDDHVGAPLDIKTIYEELDDNKVSWKIYYSITSGGCTDADGGCGPVGNPSAYPSTTFNDFQYARKYLYKKNSQHPSCVAPTVGSGEAVGDSANSFCIDPTHIAPLGQYFTDVSNNSLPSYAFIEAAFGHGDEHPGSGQSVLHGQQQVAKIINALMQSPSWSSSVFFLSYDEPGGPYDHVPPVPGSSNVNTSSSLGTIPDISTIALSPDSYLPCVPAGGIATFHCDLFPNDPGANPGDAAAQNGFGAQLGARVPNIVISPFTRKHYVSHIPMDHTGVIRFVENRFIGPSAHLTSRDAAQPDLLDFFDFAKAPWSKPPAPPDPNPPPGNCDPVNMQ